MIARARVTLRPQLRPWRWQVTGSTARQRKGAYTLRSRVMIVLGGFFVAWFGASTATTLAQSGDAYWQAQLAFMALLYVAMYWRGMMVSLRVTQDGLRVRNVWRTHHLPWEDIEGFDEHRNRAGLFRIRAHLRDGTVVPLAVVTLVGSDPDTWGRRVHTHLVAHQRAVGEGRLFDQLPDAIPTLRAPRAAGVTIWARAATLLLLLVLGLPLMAPALPAWAAWSMLGILVGSAGAVDAVRSSGLGTRSWYWMVPGAALSLLRLASTSAPDTSVTCRGRPWIAGVGGTGRAPAARPAAGSARPR